LLPADFFDQHHVERICARVTKLDANAREITIDHSRTLSYDAVLFAPGSVPKVPDIDGVSDPAIRERVVLLRGLDDARQLDRLASAGGHAVVIGSSFIGLEVASALRKRGLQVTVVAPGKTPFATQFGDEIGAHFRALHERNGTAFRMGTTVAAIRANQPLRVELDDGTALGCDFVLVGTGVRPATDCLEGVARNEDGGLDVDASMRVAEAFYAAGDVAAFRPAPGNARVRIEHWRVAQQQARAASRAMLGLDAAPSPVPFFWTYHYGKRFDYLGHARAGDWDQLVTTGSLDSNDFVTLFARDNSVLAALACNREPATALLAEALRDPLTLDAALQLIENASRDS
jgi:NADPH-dependent 2,4-dienoyl-CoA reductase/sulfur reductase-like enzyme